MDTERRGTTDWTDDGGALVLVESTDGSVNWAAARVLDRHGYTVATCEGPGRPGGCPLVRTGRCDLVEEADVVVHALDPDTPEHAEVLRALRELHPSKPVIVEVTHPKVERHAELLETCWRLPFPMTRRSLVRSVAQALGDGER